MRSPHVKCQLATLDDRGIELATVEIAQEPGKRGHYLAHFDEDILGTMDARFVYGLKSLNHCDLLLRAICWALFGKDNLGPKPALIHAPSMEADGVKRFHVEGLAEPAKTGFQRYRGINFPTVTEPDPMPKESDYVLFLMRG